MKIGKTRKITRNTAFEKNKKRYLKFKEVKRFDHVSINLPETCVTIEHLKYLQKIFHEAKQRDNIDNPYLDNAIRK